MNVPPIRFHYSLRSPYAWLAAERLAAEGIAVRPLPSIGFAEGTVFGDPAANPPRMAYLIEDVARLAARRGLALAPPAATPDTAWRGVHAAADHAARQGAGLSFVQAAARARWTESADLADPAVIAGLARAAGLDPDAVVAAMTDTARQTGMEAAYRPLVEHDQVFGVPFLAFDGPDGRVHRYWGQDRIDLMLEEARALGVL